MLKNGNFTFLLLEIILADELADLPPPVFVKNGNFTLLLLELILADAVADLLADLPPSSGIWCSRMVISHF